MDDINIQLHYKKLIEKRDNYNRYLEQAKEMYRKELNKHTRIVLYGSIISIILFFFLRFRESYNFFLAEILFSQLIAGPLTFILIVLIIFILRSGMIAFLLTRKNEIIIYKWRIRRGIPDEIDSLELDLAKIELEIEEYEKEYDDNLNIYKEI